MRMGSKKEKGKEKTQGDDQSKYRIRIELL
jgi:hypothetical protein